MIPVITDTGGRYALAAWPLSVPVSFQGLVPGSCCISAIHKALHVLAA